MPNSKTSDTERVTDFLGNDRVVLAVDL